MSHTQQAILDFDDLTVGGKLKLHLKLKSYIQPFERLLAQGELYGLVGQDYTSVPFSSPAESEVTLHTSTSPEFLHGRLAYWEQIGTWRLQPTLQVQLEAEKNLNEFQDPLNFTFHRSRKLRYGPHGFHEYRGKFFPQLVRALINFAGLKPGKVVLDPMCGSGTTNCEARSMGMRTIGVDLNPLSVKISRVKTEMFNVDGPSFEAHIEHILSALDRADVENTQITLPWNEQDLQYLQRWFDPLALQEIAGILDAIGTCPNSTAKEFLEICLSNILRPISWQKDSDLRVRKEIKEYEVGTARKLFSAETRRNMEKTLSYLSCFTGDFNFPQYTIKEGDSRRISKVLPKWAEKCDLLITSPPYAMALPYIDTDRLSLTLLGLLPRSDHRRREFEMIGNREITDSERQQLWEHYLERRNELPKKVRDVVEKVDLANKTNEVGFRRKNLSALLGKYFLDMADAMRDALAMMKPGSHGFYVVGNNSTFLNGERFEVETDNLLWEIGKTVGWKQKKIISMELLPSRDIFRHNRGSAESILWFEAPADSTLERTAIYGSASVQVETLSNGGEWDFHNEDTQQHLHALHSYPARFIPQIPRKAILAWSEPGDTVIDPFGGCGTTLLESILLGRNVVGIDNNAVASLISRAKVADYSSKDIATLEGFLEHLDGTLGDIPPTVSLPEYHNITYWFSDNALRDLSRLKAAVAGLTDSPHTLALAVFSSIIVRASNQDSDTRYARIERVYKDGDAIKWFKARLYDALNRLKQISDLPRAKAEIHCTDGRDLSFLAKNSAHLIVTSPPYINAYDYHKYHRHRIHWIDGDVGLARDAEIGKHDTFTRPKATPDRYFEDMRMCFKEWQRILVPGGKAFIVIGDGIVSKKPVPVGDTFVEIMEALGLRLTDRWIRNLQTTKKSFNQNGRINKEHLLLFSKV